MKLLNAIDYCETSYVRRVKIFEGIRFRIENEITSSFLIKLRMLYFVHTYFFARKNIGEGSFDRISIVSSPERIFELFRPAGDERPVRGSFTNRLVGVGQLEARVAWLLAFSWRRQSKRKRRRQSSTTEGTRLLVFARLPNDGQRSP